MRLGARFDCCPEDIDDVDVLHDLLQMHVIYQAYENDPGDGRPGRVPVDDVDLEYVPDTVFGRDG